MNVPRKLELLRRLQKGSSLHLTAGLIDVTYVNLWIAPTTPGQPISISWDLHSLKGTGLDAGTVTARVYHDAFNVLLYTSQPVAVVAEDFGIGTGAQQAVIAPPSGSVGNDLYHVGKHQLRLEVTSSATGCVFTTENDLEIALVRAFNWTWVGAEGTPDSSAPPLPLIPFLPHFDFLINHDYKVKGQVVDTAQNVNLTFNGSATLVETPFGSGDGVDVESIAFTVGPGGHIDHIFSEIKKNWTWLIQGIWVRNFSEPLAKTWVYTVRLNGWDAYQNFYDDAASNTLTVTVSVSDEKQAYADGALAALGVGLIVAIFTFGSGLSAAQAIAGGLGSRALDPPEPDPRYRSIVDTTDVAPQRPTDTRFVDLMDVLRWAGRATRLFDALGDTENRLLGARQARDADAIQLQRESYRAIEIDLRKSVEALLDAATQAAAAARARDDFNPDALEGTLRAWQRAGISSDTRARLIEQHVSDETMAIISRAVQEEVVVTLARDLPQILGVMAFSIAQAARLLFARTERVIDEARFGPSPL